VFPAKVSNRKTKTVENSTDHSMQHYNTIKAESLRAQEAVFFWSKFRHEVVYQARDCGCWD
jgi:hypothetical protein